MCGGSNAPRSGAGESVLFHFDAFGLELLVSRDRPVRSQSSYQRTEDGKVTFKHNRNLSKAIGATAHELSPTS